MLCRERLCRTAFCKKRGDITTVFIKEQAALLNEQSGFLNEQADDDLPAVGVVPVEGEAVGEPGVDVVQAHLLAGRVCQSLKSVDYLEVLEKYPFSRPLLLRHHR